MGYTTKTCPNCGEEFAARSNQTFCCDNCRYLYHARRKTSGVQAGPEDDDVRRRASSMGARNRAKGARAENEVCHILGAITGCELHRNLGQARDSGGDVDWGPFLLEVKYQRVVAMPKWQNQVVQAAGERGMVPAVVYRRPGEKFWISLPFEDFVTLFDTLRKKAGIE